MSTHPDSRLLMPDERWAALFTPAMLQPFTPKRGDRDDPIPTLEVHFIDYPTPTDAMALMVLAAPGWDESAEGRREILAKAGSQMAERRWQVYALRLASAAWMREFTPDEDQARQGRKVETYDDKTENMLVAGSTRDQRHQVAYARIHRDKIGRVRAVGKWALFPPEGQMEFYLLESAWQSYMRRYIELTNAPTPRLQRREMHNA